MIGMKKTLIAPKANLSSKNGVSTSRNLGRACLMNSASWLPGLRLEWAVAQYSSVSLWRFRYHKAKPLYQFLADRLTRHRNV